MKVKKEFLKRVIEEGIVYTKKYQYKAFEHDVASKTEIGKFHKLWIIKRIEINYVCTTRYLEEIFWEKVATTWDGEKFLHT